MKRRIILAGGGHAHLAVLADWARTPLPGTERWLVTSARHTAYSGMLPGWMAGLYRKDELLIDLEPLAREAGATLVIDDVIGVDPARRVIHLASGAAMDFDLLSLATGGETDVSRLARLGERLLPVRPIGTILERWSTFREAAEQASTGPLAVAIVGGGAAGVELALGAAISLGPLAGRARVALVSPAEGFLAGQAPRARKHARAALQDRGVAVLDAEAAGTADGLVLSNGDLLPADLVIAATGSRAPPWLAESGLACTAEGFVAVGADLRSISHAAIFAAGDIIDRVDRKLERSGVHAVKAGPVLAANLRAAIGGTKLRQYCPRRRTLYLLGLGDGRAIGTWGRFVATGRFVWWLKDWIDRRFVQHYTRKHDTSRGIATASPSEQD